MIFIYFSSPSNENPLNAKDIAAYLESEELPLANTISLLLNIIAIKLSWLNQALSLGVHVVDTILVSNYISLKYIVLVSHVFL